MTAIAGVTVTHENFDVHPARRSAGFVAQVTLSLSANVIATALQVNGIGSYQTGGGPPHACAAAVARAIPGAHRRARADPPFWSYGGKGQPSPELVSVVLTYRIR